MPNIRLIVEYVGTNYHGWQIQPGVPTIQGVLQKAVSVSLRVPVVTRGAARTDAGVHALGQVASFIAPGPVDCRRLLRSLNALLPSDIAVRIVEEAPAGFHPRHSARGRIYRYQIVEGESLSPFLAPFAAHSRHALDVAAMDEAARRLLGRHDFSSFRAAGDMSDSPVREIRASRVTREGDGSLIVYTVEGNSFLQHMVRNIAGTLIDVGRGRFSASRMSDILGACDRRHAGPTAAARGLCLMNVMYD